MSKITEIQIGEYDKIKKLIQSWDSQQVEWNDVLSMPRWVWIYDAVYDWSYIVSAIVKKISNAVATWWDVDDDKLKKWLNKFPVRYAAKCLTKYWNCYLEIIRTKEWKITKVLPIITSTIVRIKGWWFKQQVDAKITYFNEFTPISERQKGVKIWKESWAKNNELAYNKKAKSCWYNPNLNEVIQLKEEDTTSKYYWKSPLDACLFQILLLRYIDDYYNNYFDNGCIRLSFFHVKNLKEWEELTTEDKKAFADFIKEQAKWIKNAHKTILFESEIWKVDLTDELDANQWIEYRKELQKSVAMAMTMPYDLIDPKDWNRATSTVSLEDFNQNTITPLQEIILDAVQMMILDDPQWKKKEVEEIAFNPANKKDLKTESETVKNLLQNKVITINEAREWMWYKPVEWWDEFLNQSEASFTLWKDDVETVKKTAALIKKDYYDNWVNK